MIKQNGAFGALVLVLGTTSVLSAADSTSPAEAAGAEGVRLIKAGKPKEALPHLSEAIRLAPDDKWHYLHRGIAYCDLRQFDKSLEDVDRALAIDPRMPQAWLNRGNLCQRVGRYKQGIAHYDRALAMSPPPWLEKMIRTARANNVRNQHEVLKGILMAPQGDVAKLAQEAGSHRNPMAFWKRIGQVQDFNMQRTDSLGSGYRERTRYSTIRCVRIEMPMGRGKWQPMPVYLPLERGEILNDSVTLSCQPGVAILWGPDPIGHTSFHVRLYLEWLYYKSGI